MDAVAEPVAGDAGRVPLVAALTVAMALAVLPSVAIGVLAPLLIADLEISRSELGGLAAITAGVAAALAPAAGAVVDRIGERTTMLLVLGTGIVGLAAMGLARTYATMAVALAVGALCRAGSNPTTNRVITARLAPGRRGWVTGIKQSGETVAVVVAAAALPAAALVVGWRAALLLVAGAACVAIPVALAGIPAAPAPAGALAPTPVTAPARRPPRAAWPRRAAGDGRDGAAIRAAGGGRRAVRVRPSIHWLAAYSFAMGTACGCVTTYLPLYAHERGGLTVAGAGTLMAVAGVVATGCRIAFSRFTEMRLTAPRALALLALGAAVGTVLLTAAPVAGSGALWLGAALWGASGLGFGSVCMLVVMAESDGVTVGRASGLVVFGFGFGTTLTPPAFGWLVDRGHGYALGLLLVAAGYVVAAAIIVAGRSRFRSLAS